MTDLEFRNYLDSDGHMVKPEEFRLSIYQGGIEPSLRRVVWRHLLNIYPKDMSGRERFDYMKKKEKEYFELRDKWRKLFSSRQVSDEAKHIASLVKKDVLRTDRTHKYYSGGDDSKNLVALYNLLVTYALTHPEVSYCQGMSDIASPLLVVQKEEAQAYLCFCGLMKRLRSNFMYDGEAITTKLQHLSFLVRFYDPVFSSYMKDHDAEDLFFCYRWLLLEMKREFPFEDALYMLEVMWSTIPPSPPQRQLDLADMTYSPALLMSISPNSPSFALKTQYAHLLAKRRLISVHAKDGAKSPKLSKSPNPSCTTLKQSVENKHSVIQDENSRSVDITVSSCEENGRLTPVAENNASSETVQTVLHVEQKLPTIQQYCASLGEKTDLESSYENSRYSKEARKEGSSVNNNIDSGEETSNTSTESTGSNSSSYLSASQSVERFPSLITASVEERNVFDDPDTEPEVISSIESNTLIETGTVLENKFLSKAIDDQSVEQEVDMTGQCHQSEDESDDQSQFHLSLDDTDKLAEKKKSTIPQIKGSFFSGMKRILSSPKRRAGQVQQVNGNIMVHKTGVKMDNNSKNGKSRKDSNLGLKVSPGNGENEHTLFEVNRLIRCINTVSKDPVDTDSGTGSLSSSANSTHVQGTNRHRSSSQGSEKSRKNLKTPGDILTKDQRDYFDKKYEETVSEIPQASKESTANKESTAMCSEKTPSFCVDHFGDEIIIISNEEIARTDESKDMNGISDCTEATDPIELELARFKQLPSPDEFGYGNPFLMFICLTVLLQHRDIIMSNGMEYDELAMYFDRMVRKHNVHKVLHQTRILYTEYIRMQQKLLEEEEVEAEEGDFSV